MAGRRYTFVFYVAVAIAAIATFGVYRVLENTKASSRIATRPLVVAAALLGRRAAHQKSARWNENHVRGRILLDSSVKPMAAHRR